MEDVIWQWGEAKEREGQIWTKVWEDFINQIFFFFFFSLRIVFLMMWIMKTGRGSNIFFSMWASASNQTDFLSLSLMLSSLCLVEEFLLVKTFLVLTKWGFYWNGIVVCLQITDCYSLWKISYISVFHDHIQYGELFHPAVFKPTARGCHQNTVCQSLIVFRGNCDVWTWGWQGEALDRFKTCLSTNNKDWLIGFALTAAV